MGKDKGTKVIAIVALIIAVLGMTIGFASYSRTFSISTTSDSVVKKGVDAFSTGLFLSTTEGNGTVTDETTWSGLTGTITSTEKAISYSATLNNQTDYVAYLKSISSNSGKLVCTAVNPADTNASLVQAACEGLTLTIDVGDYSGTITKSQALASSNLNDGSYIVGKQSTSTVTMTLTLSDDAVMPDGDFYVTIPAITFDYTSLKNN